MQLDALVVGGGFSGCYFLHLLRKRGYNVKLVDALDGFGGVWRKNWYPGARVDCEMPYYMLAAPELAQTWTWTEKFPGADELRSYFQHVDRVWELSKDSYLNTSVVEAKWSDQDQVWRVVTDSGLQFSCKWFLPATGSSCQEHIPDFQGLSDFTGQIIHPASWPRGDPLDVIRNKRVGIIGCGASAIQIVQEAAKVSLRLTQFIRTPNIALPMGQRQVTKQQIESMRPEVQSMLRHVKTTPSGLPLERRNRKTFDDPPEEREALWNRLWEKAGFNFAAAGYMDVPVDRKANNAAFQYWRKRQASRVSDPSKRDVVVPEKQPYWFVTKRCSMEQDYYEMISRSNVDVTTSLIKNFDRTGICTEDGKHWEFDVVVASTGYDALTGSLTNMNIIGRDSVSLATKWKQGVRTHLGLCSNGFPNMFFVYGPQAPTPLTAGPPFIEQQVDWVVDVMDKAKAHGWSTVEATSAAEEEWVDLITSIAGRTLLMETNSWYNGANVSGKKREPLVYLGGMQTYLAKCREAIRADEVQGFECM